MVPTNPIIIATEQSDAQPAVTGDAAGRAVQLAAERRGPITPALIAFLAGAYDSRVTQ